MSEKLPKYAPFKTIKTRVAEVSGQQLRHWADLGYIRSAKLGDGPQAARLYHVDDVLDVVERLCLGRKPAKKRRLPQRSEEDATAVVDGESSQDAFELAVVEPQHPSTQPEKQE